VESYSVPALVDYNADGLVDLLVGEKTATDEGKIRIYLNQGTNESPVYGTFAYAQTTTGDLVVPGSGCLGAFPRMHDLTGDNKKDLVIGLADGRVQLWSNVGTNQAPVFAEPQYIEFGESGTKAEINVGARATFEVTDWNNDGRDDLVVGGMDGRVRVFLDEAPSGIPDFRSEQFVHDGDHDLVLASGRSSVAVADLNGDGRKDLVVGDTDGKLRFYPNIGTDSVPAFTGWQPIEADGVAIDLEGTPRSRPFVGDFNNDGMFDLLAGFQDGLVRLYSGLTPGGPINLPQPLSGEAGGRYVHTFEIVSDLGPIDFLRLDGLRLTAGDLLYVFETTHEGTLTLEVVSPQPAKSARLRLYDQNPLEIDGISPMATSSLVGENQRIDWPTAAGAVYYVEVYGDNPDFDVRIANLLSHVGTTVTVHGTNGNDTFEFDAAASRDVTINGVRYHFDDAEVEAVTFDGGDGYDMVILDDSTGDDTLTAEARHAVFSNSDRTPGFTVTVDGFEELQAYARSGGTDKAFLYDSDANDKFKSEPAENYAKMYGGRMYNRVKFYDVVEAFSSGEKDLARLFDTSGNDVFEGQQDVSWLRTDVFDVGVHNFRQVIAYALEDGNDVATLRDSALMDEVYLKSHKSEIVDLETKGEIYKITARGFDLVHADGSQGAEYDRVKMWETPRDNHVEAADNWAKFFVQKTELEMLYDVLAFEFVRVRASTGGNDTATVTEPLDFDLLFEEGWDV
jgi:hypothetical protein